MIKLISLNAESHRHLTERTIPFLLREQPDVICLQEIFAADVPILAQALAAQAFFAPMGDVREVSVHQHDALGEWGLLILSRLPVVNYAHRHYVKQPDSLPLFLGSQNPNSFNRVVAWVEVKDGEDEYTIATTHFTWSPQGSFTAEQQETYLAMMAILDNLPPHVLCGDFNSPRLLGVDNVFARLAERYHDAIPSHYTTSIDGQFHKAGPLELMVDGLFVDDEYQASQVRLEAGVSDHMAVVADLTVKED